MDVKQFIEDLGPNKEEVLRRGAQCQSAAELLELAKEHGVDLDEAGSAELYVAMHQSITELSDDELDAVAGGYKYLCGCSRCGKEFMYPTLSPEFCPHCKQRIK